MDHVYSVFGQKGPAPWRERADRGVELSLPQLRRWRLHRRTPPMAFLTGKPRFVHQAARRNTLIKLPSSRSDAQGTPGVTQPIL